MFRFTKIAAHLWAWGMKTGWNEVAPTPYEDEALEEVD
jgi:hypothetical protein